MACILRLVKLPWKNSEPVEPQADDIAPDTADEGEAPKPVPRGYTPPKGRPTPKRRDREAERHHHGGASLAPTTPNLVREERKKLKSSMTKEEWKAYKRRERAESRENQRKVREAMDRGDERYLLPRDKGKERAYVRDFVDSKRYLNNWVLLLLVILLMAMFITTGSPRIAQYVSIASTAAIGVLFIEGIFIGRAANRAVRKAFPETTQTGIGLGFYAYSRATQPRSWRSPKPRVTVGDEV